MGNEQQAQQTPKVKTASERLANLEGGLDNIYQAADNIARDTTMLKEAIKLLGNKVDAIVKLTSKGEALTDESITKVMIENNVTDLKSKVDTLLANNQIELTSEPIATSTFVVGREINTEGEVANPRLQFVVGSLTPEVQTKLVGKTAGDLIEFQEGKLKFEILETYSIVMPKAPVETTPDQAEAAPATPDATQSSTNESQAPSEQTPVH